VFSPWTSHQDVEGEPATRAIEFACEIHIEGLPVYAWDVFYAQVALDDCCVVTSFELQNREQDAQQKFFKLCVMVDNPADIPGSCLLTIVEPNLGMVMSMIIMNFHVRVMESELRLATCCIFML